MNIELNEYCFLFSAGKFLFEGDIKIDHDEKHVSNGQDAAVSCSSHRIRCDRLWDGGVIPYVISRGIRKSLHPIWFVIFHLMFPFNKQLFISVFLNII